MGPVRELAVVANRSPRRGGAGDERGDGRGRMSKRFFWLFHWPRVCRRD